MDEQSNQRGSDKHPGKGDLLEPDLSDEIAALMDGLAEGKLSPSQQRRLGEALPEPAEEIEMMYERSMFSGPLPHPDLLKDYDLETRKRIVDMAHADQKHTHDMQRTGLQGAIDKDKRGQQFGLVIGVVGLLVAAYVSRHNAAAAAIIAGLDLVGLVGLFVVPRVFEQRERARLREKSADDNDDG